MKLIYVLLGALLICSCYIDSSASVKTNVLDNIKVPGKLLLHWCKKILNINSKRINLCPDLIYEIMEHMDIRDLLTMAKLNNRMSALASDVYRRKYTYPVLVIDENSLSAPFWKKFVMNFISTFGYGLKEDDYFIMYNNHFHIQDYDWTMEILKYFGKQIPSIEIHYIVYENRQIMTKVNECINLYCADTLEALIVYGGLFNLIDGMNKPFKNVRRLSSYMGVLKRHNFHRLNYLFPAFEDLTMTFWADGYSYSGNHFRNLKYMHLDLSMTYKEHIECAYDLLVANTQIRSLKLNSDSEVLLRVAAEKLYQLQNLTLQSYLKPSSNIHFATVSKLVLDQNWISIENISFTNLHDLQVNTFGNHYVGWTKFFLQNPNITRLNMLYSYMPDTYFDLMMEELPNVGDLTITHLMGPYITLNTIQVYLRTHPLLKSLQINWGTDSIERGILDSDINYVWDIETSQDECVKFQRKSQFKHSAVE